MSDQNQAQNSDALTPQDVAELIHAQQQLYSAGDARAGKLYNYIVSQGYANADAQGGLQQKNPPPQSWYDANIKGTLSGNAGWQQAIDKAATPPEIHNAGDAANALGAGATQIFGSPVAHPLRTLGGMAEMGLAGLGDTQAQVNVGQKMVTPFVQNPSGSAVAAVPQAILAALGGGEAPGAMKAGANVAESVLRGGKRLVTEEEGSMVPPPNLQEALKTKLGGPPEQMMTSAIKPGKNNINWTSDIKTALPYMKSAEEQLGVPIGGIDDALAASKAAKNAIWNQVQQRLGPAGQMGTVVDGNPIADAMMKSIDKRTALQNPGLVDQVNAAADMYRRPISVQDAEDFIQSNNRELIGYYAKNKISQSAAEADPMVAAKVAEGNALRDALYSKIDEMSGPGIAQLKRTYGALSNVQKELAGRQIVYARQAPVNLPEQLSYLRAAGKIATGNVLGGVKDIAVQRFLSDLNDTNSQIARAFRNSDPAAPLPAPTWRAPQTTNLLPAQAGGKIPLMAPDPGMSPGENLSAYMQLLRQGQQLRLPSQASPIQLPPQF